MIPRQILDDHVIRVMLITREPLVHAKVASLFQQFRHGNHHLDTMDEFASGLAAVEIEDHDVYLVHQALGTTTGLDLIHDGLKLDTAAPFILLTDSFDPELDTEALSVGATDTLRVEELSPDALERAIRHALIHAQTRTELIAARDAAEAATEAKTRFLANLSHDLRTPLNTILGITEILLRDDVTPTQRESLETILVAGETLVDMADRIIDISSIESGRIELEPVPVNIRDAVADVVRIFGLQARQKGLYLGVDIPTAIPEVVTADPARFQQILIDLVSNAVKFTDSGSVTITVTGLEERDGHHYLQMNIEDTGAGIPAELQASLFERSAGATTEAGSTGLGVVQKIINAMGGSINVHSKVGRGTRFDFAIRVGVVSQTTSAATPINRGGGVVLVMSSSPEDRRAIESDLVGAGFEPLIVGDVGSAARALDATHPLDAIVLDTAYKPFETAMTLMERAGGTTPATLVVPSGREGDEPRCREFGVKGYVTKPLAPGVLVDVVKATIAAAQAGDTTTLFTADSLVSSRPTMNILVVDDVETNLVLTVRMLKERGHVATAVRNGVEAIDAFEQARFDAVLMDLQMPGLDGFDTTAAIRAEEVLQGLDRTPIIALTGHTTKEERDRCLGAGMDGFLAKPVRPDALYAAVEQFCNAVAAA